ncbi:hypothetical protein, partial [Streptomyces sp. NPDC057386]|uniref:hypothetical protein n=1 Tax=Streptomyces sp. NPDC057386 TaxID=3346114 RepID=UPI003645B263
TAQRILDGELLTLRPFAESLPPAVLDDVSEAPIPRIAPLSTFLAPSVAPPCPARGIPPSAPCPPLQPPA